MSQKVKTGYISALSFFCVVIAIGIGVYFYQNAPSNAPSLISKQIELCEDKKDPKSNWRVYTGSIPSPSTSWNVYSTAGVICHIINTRIRPFSIDTKMIKKIGCTDGDYALYCLPNGKPQRHPRYDEIMNP